MLHAPVFAAASSASVVNDAQVIAFFTFRRISTLFPCHSCHAGWPCIYGLQESSVYYSRNNQTLDLRPVTRHNGRLPLASRCKWHQSLDQIEWVQQQESEIKNPGRACGMFVFVFQMEALAAAGRRYAKPLARERRCRKGKERTPSKQNAG